MSTSVSLHNVTLSRDNSTILSDISLHLEAGNIYALLGPNGAGKSSLLKAIARELPLQAGELQFFGQDSRSWNASSLAKKLAILPQHHALNFPFSVREVVELGRYPRNTDSRQNRKVVQAVLHELDIDRLSERKYPHLSGGEKQRVQIARVLAQIWDADDYILLMDEPNDALDLEHQTQLMNCLDKLARKPALAVLALHDLNIAAQYCDRWILLDNGFLVHNGSAQNAIDRGLIDKTFKISCEILRHPKSGKPVLVF